MATNHSFLLNTLNDERSITTYPNTFVDDAFDAGDGAGVDDLSQKYGTLKSLQIFWVDKSSLWLGWFWSTTQSILIYAIFDEEFNLIDDNTQFVLTYNEDGSQKTTRTINTPIYGLDFSSDGRVMIVAQNLIMQCWNNLVLTNNDTFEMRVLKSEQWPVNISDIKDLRPITTNNLSWSGVNNQNEFLSNLGVDWEKNKFVFMLEDSSQENLRQFLIQGKLSTNTDTPTELHYQLLANSTSFAVVNPYKFKLNYRDGFVSLGVILKEQTFNEWKSGVDRNQVQRSGQGYNNTVNGATLPVKGRPIQKGGINGDFFKVQRIYGIIPHTMSNAGLNKINFKGDIQRKQSYWFRFLNPVFPMEDWTDEKLLTESVNWNPNANPTVEYHEFNATCPGGLYTVEPTNFFNLEFTTDTKIPTNELDANPTTGALTPEQRRIAIYNWDQLMTIETKDFNGVIFMPLKPDMYLKSGNSAIRLDISVRTTISTIYFDTYTWPEIDLLNTQDENLTEIAGKIINYRFEDNVDVDNILIHQIQTDGEEITGQFVVKGFQNIQYARSDLGYLDNNQFIFYLTNLAGDANFSFFDLNGTLTNSLVDTNHVNQLLTKMMIFDNRKIAIFKGIYSQEFQRINYWITSINSRLNNQAIVETNEIMGTIFYNFDTMFLAWKKVNDAYTIVLGNKVFDARRRRNVDNFINNFKYDDSTDNRNQANDPVEFSKLAARINLKTQSLDAPTTYLLSAPLKVLDDAIISQKYYDNYRNSFVFSAIFNDKTQANVQSASLLFKSGAFVTWKNQDFTKQNINEIVDYVLLTKTNLNDNENNTFIKEWLRRYLINDVSFSDDDWIYELRFDTGEIIRFTQDGDVQGNWLTRSVNGQVTVTFNNLNDNTSFDYPIEMELA